MYFCTNLLTCYDHVGYVIASRSSGPYLSAAAAFNQEALLGLVEKVLVHILKQLVIVAVIYVDPN